MAGGLRSLAMPAGSHHFCLKESFIGFSSQAVIFAPVFVRTEIVDSVATQTVIVDYVCSCCAHIFKSSIGTSLERPRQEAAE
mmetsp:Transcript_25906/g.57175  ORF Transcript_25906/g.57175 Transcript_25906/m.57175 type:complete len:82 (+) Transcript_25906:44-289(+)